MMNVVYKVSNEVGILFVRLRVIERSFFGVVDFEIRWV